MALAVAALLAEAPAGVSPRHNINGGHIPSNSNYYRHSLDHQEQLLSLTKLEVLAMDHLINVHKCTIADLIVPYVCTERFTYGKRPHRQDDADWYSFPFRCGMSKSEDLPDMAFIDQDGQSIDELAPFLQAWLFFGTLHALFENLFKIRGFNEADFIDMTEDGSLKINTTRLSMLVTSGTFEYALNGLSTDNFGRYIWYWAAWESHIPLELRNGAIRATGIINNVEVVLTKLVEYDRRRIGPFSPHHGITDMSKPPGHLILLSIILLCETLDSAMREIYQHLRDTPHLSCFRSIFPSTLILRLEAAGWCPGQIQMLEAETGLNCSTTYLLGSMEMALKGKGHSLCTKARCRAYDVDYETYVTKHVDVGCRCMGLPRKDTAELVSISKALNGGELPLLWLEDSGIDRDALVRVTSCRLVSHKHDFLLCRLFHMLRILLIDTDIDRKMKNSCHGMLPYLTYGLTAWEIGNAMQCPFASCERSRDK